MNRLIIAVLIVWAVLPSPANADERLSREIASQFMEALISDTVDISPFILHREYLAANRLGIQYDNVTNKFLIQYDVGHGIKRKIRKGLSVYDIEVEPLPDNFSVLLFSLKKKDYQREFYFKGTKLVSKSYFFTKSWKSRESRYFRYKVKNMEDYNDYAANKLDEFVDELCNLLQIDGLDKSRLQQHKITYILCHTTDELEEITGFKSRGNYILSGDQIVSTFNCHRHEVAHLLINYKLKQLPLFTHPFLQEGFACAVGGRGGKATEVITELGAFIQESQALTLEELLDSKDFLLNDPSITYPLSGFYNSFLLGYWGLEKYLDFYLSFSWDAPNPKSQAIKASGFPPSDKIDAFAADFQKSRGISFPDKRSNNQPLLDRHWGTVREDSSNYHFRIRGSIRLKPNNPQKGFASQEFREMFPDVPYNGEQYLIEVAENEVKVFNFYTAALEAIYSNGLSMTKQQIKDENGYFRFTLSKSLFDESLSGFDIAQ